MDCSSQRGQPVERDGIEMIAVVDAGIQAG